MMILNINVFHVLVITGLPSGFLAIHEETVASSLYSTPTLPCTFPFVEASADLTLMWVKDEDQREVIIYKLLNGKERLEEQDPRYKGRVELSKMFPQGNLHLTMRNATYKDEGTYHCRAANRKGHGIKKVTLSIDKLNADETTVTLVTIDGKRCMKCRGIGVYHAPQIQWITTKGKDLSRHGKHNFTEKSDGRMLVESALHYDVGTDVQVLCHIMEGRLNRSARAVISDGTHPVVIDDKV